ncbi:MAG: hypothetical protein R2867_17125 [Caldilineaceae bacterium]
MPAVPSSGWRGPGSGQVPTGYRADPSGRVEKPVNLPSVAACASEIGGGGGRFVLGGCRYSAIPARALRQ